MNLVIKMNIYKPIINELSEESNLYLLIEQYKRDGISIENKSFNKIEEIDLNCEEIEFEKCVFKNCKIVGNLERASFHDIIFENCDFSNCIFKEGSFIRVEIKNCKMVGCDFSDSRIYHFTCNESNFEYANFSNTNFEGVLFENCDLSSVAFSECKFKNVYFEKSKLIYTQFFGTKLNNVDVTSCEMYGIVTKMEDIKGFIVNNFQAIELSKLMGIVIK